MKPKVLFHLWPVSAFCLFLMATSPATAQTNYTILTTFTNPAGPVIPFGSLIWGTNGRLYSTTGAGGASNKGTVFAINPNGSGLNILRSFITNDGTTMLAGVML